MLRDLEANQTAVLGPRRDRLDRLPAPVAAEAGKASVAPLNAVSGCVSAMGSDRGPRLRGGSSGLRDRGEGNGRPG